MTVNRCAGWLRQSVRRTVAAGVLCAAAMNLRGDVVGSFVINGDGTVTYFYEVDNSTGLFDIAAWSLDLPVSTPDWDQLDSFAGGGVAVPDPNWIADAGIPVSGQSAQDFLSMDPGSDVLVGSILDGFSLTSAYLPGTVGYYEFSASGDFSSGNVVGPAIPVPEADFGGIRALTFALAITAGWFARRRVRAS